MKPYQQSTCACKTALTDNHRKKCPPASNQSNLPVGRYRTNPDDSSRGYPNAEIWSITFPCDVHSTVTTTTTTPNKILGKCTPRSAQKHRQQQLSSFLVALVPTQHTASAVYSDSRNCGLPGRSLVGVCNRQSPFCLRYCPTQKVFSHKITTRLRAPRSNRRRSRHHAPPASRKRVCARRPDLETEITECASSPSS